MPGLWLTTSFTTEYDDKTVASFLDGMRERDIPLEVFHYVSMALGLLGPWLKPCVGLLLAPSVPLV